VGDPFNVLLHAARDGALLPWCVEHASDGDVDAAIRRAWGASRAPLDLLLVAVGAYERPAVFSRVMDSVWHPARENVFHAAQLRVDLHPRGHMLTAEFRAGDQRHACNRFCPTNCSIRLAAQLLRGEISKYVADLAACNAIRMLYDPPAFARLLEMRRG
jgi:hypothetical protein